MRKPVMRPAASRASDARHRLSRPCVSVRKHSDRRSATLTGGPAHVHTTARKHSRENIANRVPKPPPMSGLMTRNLVVGLMEHVVGQRIPRVVRQLISRDQGERVRRRVEIATDARGSMGTPVDAAC